MVTDRLNLKRENNRGWRFIMVRGTGKNVCVSVCVDGVYPSPTCKLHHDSRKRNTLFHTRKADNGKRVSAEMECSPLGTRCNITI